MAGFLSDEWVLELHEAAGRVAAPEGVTVTIQQIVTDGGTEIAYWVSIADGRVTVTPGRAPDPDVTFIQDRPTAVAIARGELSAQAAFIGGRIRVGGELNHLIDDARELALVSDVFAATRSATTW